MKLLPNTIYILSIHFNTPEEFTAKLFMVKSEKESVVIPENSLKESITGRLVLLYVTGAGVVSKRESPDNVEFLKRITSDKENFSYSRKKADNDTTVNFMRNSQLQLARNFVEQSNFTIVNEYFDSLRKQPTVDEILNISHYFIKEWSSGFRKLFHPGSQNSIIAYSLYKRLRIYILPALLFILLLNRLILGHLSGEYETTTGRLQSERVRKESEQKSGVEKRILITGFENNIPLKYSILCDRIASDVPEQIVLRNLSVRKVTKNPEQGREPEVADRTVEVSGSSPNPESVSSFIAALGSESFNKGLTLKLLRQERGRAQFNFLIEIIL